MTITFMTAMNDKSIFSAGSCVRNIQLVISLLYMMSSSQNFFCLFWHTTENIGHNKSTSNIHGLERYIFTGRRVAIYQQHILFIYCRYIGNISATYMFTPASSFERYILRGISLAIYQQHMLFTYCRYIGNISAIYMFTPAVWKDTS